jgi:hypothetical protein
MAALKIKVLPSAALHPAGRGQVERLVQTVKEMMSKILATNKDLNWEYLPFIVAKVLNNSISPKTGQKPCDMVLGKDGSGAAFLDFDSQPRPHPFVRSERSHIETITRQINEMTDLATEKLLQIRLARNEKINKTRIVKNFNVGDYVFVLDTQIVPGNPRPLKTRLSPSPYVVIRPLWTTTIVKRLSDGFITIYSNDMLKVYDKTSPLFSTLPKEISAVLLHKFTDLMDSDLSIICNTDPLDLPTGIQNFDAETEHNDLPHDSDDDDDQDQDLDSNDRKGKKGSKKVSVEYDEDDPQPSGSRDIDSSSESDSDDDAMLLRNQKKVRFQR